MLRHLKLILCCAVLGLATGCGPSSVQHVAEVMARPNVFPDYPQPNKTYLSFSEAHGFQVNYLGPGGRAWLWYPGNSRGVPERYKVDTVQGVRAVCWRHPAASYNPVTGKAGGDYQCEPLSLAQRTIIAVLPGDAFDLRSGKVPSPLPRCSAPKAFKFAREKFVC